MKRKLCSVLLALCMVLTLLPVSAMAEDAVAQIGNQTYSTLQEAVNAADNGATIAVAKDVDISSAGLTIASSKDVILDLNGHEVKAANTNAGSIKVYGKLTLKDSTDTNATGQGTGKITTSSTYVYGSVDKVLITAFDGEFVMESGLIDAASGISNNSNYGQFAVGVENSTKDASVTINGGKIKAGWYAIAGNGSYSTNHSGNITVNGGILESTTDYAIYHPQAGTTTINGGVVYGQAGGIAINRGTLIVNDGTITSKGVGSTGSWGDGTGNLNNAAIHANAKYGDVSVSIKNGKVLAEGNAVTIDNGTNYTATIAITGGTFSSDVAQYCAKNYYTEQNSDTTYTVKSMKDIAEAKIGDTYYKTLAAAVAAVPTDNSSTTIEVLKDVEDGAAIDFVSGQNVVINFNGHTYSLKQRPVGSTGTVNQGFRMLRGSTVVLNNGTLDLAEVEAGKSEPFLMLIHSYSTVTLNNFNVDARTNNSYTAKNNAQVPCGQYAIDVDAGTFTINGNSNITARDGWVAFVEDHWNGSYPEGVKVIFGNDFSGTVTGEFSYGSEDVAITKENKDKCLLQIGGNGTFNTGDFKINTVKDFWTNNKVNEINNIVISGGTFDFNPTAYVASGYIARKDSDTKFVVVEKANLTSGVYTSDPSGALAPGYVSYANNDGTYTVYYPVPVTPGNTSTTTTTNPDGSTTTTTTDKTTGTVTETTKNTDGSTTTVETKKDGSVTETNKTAGGSVGTIKSDANGNSEISASISAADVSAAAKKNEPVAAPVSVAPAASSAAAPVIKLSVPASAGTVSVVIPVTNAQQGTVAVKVNPDGTEEIIKTSVVTKDGVVLGVEGSAQIKIVNNDKDFLDTVGHWAESDVDFVSARELFTGTAPQTFSPEAATTRGMVVTVLARLAGENTDGGANWYDKGCAWAVANGVSDGTDPNGTVTREQLAAMLYRYFGSPAVSGSLSFADASSVSEYAHDAMQWCVNNGIINGMDGLLNPQGQATRAQVSAMFARYIHLAATK